MSALAIHTTISIIALYLCIFPAAVGAGITAFSGDTCNGAVGSDVLCDGSCIPFDTRHSFLVDGGNGNHCVTMFIGSGCPSGGEMFFFPNQDGQCTNVNTGTPIESFRCSSSNLCVS